MLTTGELNRYARQLVLPEVGVHGQERLRAARVLIVGAGGLGSPAALYLAAAGVGTIGLVDSDAVELSNLHRQILHRTADVGRAKTASASDSIAELNPHVTVQVHHERLDADRAPGLLADFDVVLDGSDNYATRYAINDACVQLRTPWVYGSVERFAGQVATFAGGGRPCYRCIYPEAPAPGATASCEEIGVLGAVPGVVGALQATEALKLLLEIGMPLTGRLQQLDFLRGEWRTIAFAANDRCPACAADAPVRAPATTTNQKPPTADIDPRGLATLLARGAGIAVIDVREPWEWEIARIAGARLIPLDQLDRDIESIDRAREVVVYCHHGTRSAIAVDWLRSMGVRARNLAGGIDRWSREVDPAIARY
jgi:molybdopterin/thiamine biosynthesis adenylyltransferase/rhodanese-related sulfurtransferase